MFHPIPLHNHIYYRLRNRIGNEITCVNGHNTFSVLHSWLRRNVRSYKLFVNNGRQSSAFLVVLLTYTCTVLTETHFAGCALLITCSCCSCLYSEIEATNARTSAPYPISQLVWDTRELAEPFHNFLFGFLHHTQLELCPRLTISWIQCFLLTEISLSVLECCTRTFCSDTFVVSATVGCRTMPYTLNCALHFVLRPLLL